MRSERHRRRWYAGLVGAALALACALLADPAAADRVPLLLVTHVRDLEGGMLGPTDVALGPDGRAYVLDGVNLRVLVFDGGRRVASFAAGTAGEDHQRPTGLAVGANGRVYVADPGASRVQVLGAGGGTVASWPLPVGAEGPADPTDIALDDAGGRAYVVDNDNHRVLIVDLGSGRPLTTIGRSGAGTGQLKYPFLATFDAPRAQLLVTEVLNARAQVFSKDGRFAQYLGSFGVSRGHFYRPKGVAADAAGRRYVSDGYMGVVQAFSPDGEFQAALGTGGGLLRLDAPSGMAVTATGLLHLVETGRNRVRVYQLPPGAP